MHVNFFQVLHEHISEFYGSETTLAGAFDGLIEELERDGE